MPLPHTSLVVAVFPHFVSDLSKLSISSKLSKLSTLSDPSPPQVLQVLIADKDDAIAAVLLYRCRGVYLDGIG